MASIRTKVEPRVAINPVALQMGAGNTIIWGRAKQYYVGEFPGPLSIKSVVRGAGTWGTRDGERVVDSGNYLVLNAGRPYSLTIDARETVESFCLFFGAGFVEDVHRVESSAADKLLDEAGYVAGVRTEFFETLHAHDDAVSPVLRTMYARVRSKSASDEWLEDRFIEIAQGLLKVHGSTKQQAQRVPAKKVSTRMELYRRLLRGKDYMDSFYGGEVQLRDAAGAACVSPYHFHRLFRRVFRETPNQYLQRKRLAQACTLLERTDLGVTQLSLDVGFESSTSFSTLFRRSFGCSPREYRLAFRKK